MSIEFNENQIKYIKDVLDDKELKELLEPYIKDFASLSGRNIMVIAVAMQAKQWETGQKWAITRATLIYVMGLEYGADVLRNILLGDSEGYDRADLRYHVQDNEHGEDGGRCRNPQQPAEVYQERGGIGMKLLKNIADKVLVVIGILLFTAFFGFLALAFFAILWEAWHETPGDRAKLDLQWEERDNIPEDVKKEMREKYMLLMTDNIPDNEHGAMHENK